MAKRPNPLRCSACGKEWPEKRKVDLCCTQEGVAIATALDSAEAAEAHSGHPGFVAQLEADLTAPDSTLLPDLMAAWGRMEATESGRTCSAIESLVQSWRRRFVYSNLTDEEFRAMDEARRNKNWRKRARDRRKKAFGAVGDD